MFIAVAHCTTTIKESPCRIICMLCQQTSPKRWFANIEHEVILWCHKQRISRNGN